MAAQATPGTTPSAHRPVVPANRVGALFDHGPDGNHFCTGSVVDSPGHDLVITAAHCLDGDRNIVFIPGYHDGDAPYGVWTPRKLIVDPRWARSSNPDWDVGFVVLEPNDGKNIEDVLGANEIEVNAGFINQRAERDSAEVRMRRLPGGRRHGLDLLERLPGQRHPQSLRAR